MIRKIFNKYHELELNKNNLISFINKNITYNGIFKNIILIHDDHRILTKTLTKKTEVFQIDLTNKNDSNM